MIAKWDEHDILGEVLMLHAETDHEEKALQQIRINPQVIAAWYSTYGHEEEGT